MSNIKLTPLQFYLQKKGKCTYKQIYDYFDKQQKFRIKIKRKPKSKLERLTTGRKSIYTFGFQTRSLNLSRGNKLGNNAFLDDPHFDDFNMGYSTAMRKVFSYSDQLNPHTVIFHDDELFEKYKNFAKTETLNDYQVSELINENIDKGNISIVNYLFNLFHNKEIYKFNYLHQAVTNLEKGAEKKLDIKNSMSANKLNNLHITPVHIACLNPNEKILEEVISKGGEIEFQDNAGRKAISYAATCKGPGPLKLLINKYNANINDRERARFTPLIHACRTRRLENVKFLLEKGADPMLKPKPGQCMCIHWACLIDSDESIGILKLLINKNPELLNAKGSGKKTPLHIAVIHGCPKIVKFLLENGAKKDATDKFTRTPLLLACKYGRSEILQILIEHKAKINKPDNSGNTPLHYACAFGHIDCVKILCENGANVNELNMWKSLPIEIALLKNKNREVIYLIKTDKFDVNTKFGNGNNILMYYMSDINPSTFSIIKYLIDKKGADVNMKNDNKMNILHFFSSFSYRQYLSLFVPYAQLIELNEEKHENMYKKIYIEMIDMYLDYLDSKGIEFDALNNLEQSPLMLSVQSGNFIFASQMIKHFKNRLNVVLFDTNNLSIFDHLSVKGRIFEEDCINFLYELLDIYKKDIDSEYLNTYSRYGKTPLLNIGESFALYVYERICFIMKKISVKYISSSTNIHENNGKTQTSVSFNIEQNKAKDICLEAINYICEFIYEKLYPLLQKLINMGADPNLYTKPKQFSNNEENDNLKYFNNSGEVSLLHYLVSLPLGKKTIDFIEKNKLDINHKDLLNQNVLIHLLHMKNQIVNISEDFFNPLYDYLLKKISNIDEQNSNGKNVFKMLIESNNKDDALKLYNLYPTKIDINQCDKTTYDNLLGQYTKTQDKESINWLINNFKGKINLNKIHLFNNQNPLHRICIQKGSTDEIDFSWFSLFLNNNVDLTQKDIYNRNPLFYLFITENATTKSGDPISSLSFLLETIKSKEKLLKILNEKDIFGNSLIFYAVKSNAVFCVSTLVSKGAEIKSFNSAGNSIFSYAVSGQNVAIVPELMGHGGEVSIFKNPLYDESNFSKIQEDIDKNKLSQMLNKPIKTEEKKDILTFNLRTLFEKKNNNYNIVANKNNRAMRNISFNQTNYIYSNNNFNNNNNLNNNNNQVDNALIKLFDEDEEGANYGMNYNDKEDYNEYWNKAYIDSENSDDSDDEKEINFDNINENEEEVKSKGKKRGRKKSNQKANKKLTEKNNNKSNSKGKGRGRGRRKKTNKDEEENNENNEKMFIETEEKIIEKNKKIKNEKNKENFIIKRKKILSLSKTNNNVYSFNYVKGIEDVIDNYLNFNLGTEQNHYNINYVEKEDKNQNDSILLFRKSYKIPIVENIVDNNQNKDSDNNDNSDDNSDDSSDDNSENSDNSDDNNNEKDKDDITKSKKTNIISDSLFKYCIEKSQNNIIYYIINQGYDAFRAIKESIECQKYKFCLTLLDRYNNINMNLLKQKTDEGKNLLHIFCSKYVDNIIENGELSTTIISILSFITSNIGIDPSETDKLGRNSLYYAIENKNFKLMNLLLGTKKEKKKLFVAKNDKNSPLNLVFDMLKKENNNFLNKMMEVVEEIFLSLSPNEFTYTFIFNSICEYLSKNYTEKSINDPFNLLTKVINIFKLLIDKKFANLMLKDTHGNDIFSYIAFENNNELFNYILNDKTLKGLIKFDQYNDKKQYFVHLLVNPSPFFSYNNVNMLKKSIELGFEYTKPDIEGLKPIDYANIFNLTEMTNILEGKTKIKSNKNNKNRNNDKIIKTEKNNDDKDEEIIRKKYEYLNDNYKKIDYNYDKKSKDYYEKVIKKYINEKNELHPIIKEKELVVSMCQLKRENYEIYKDNEYNTLYNVYLTKVDAGKYLYGEYLFYHLQLLKNFKKNMFNLITRWGRFGETGEYQNTPFASEEEAINEFEKIFNSKTGNEWSSIKDDLENKFDKKDKKYHLLITTDEKYEIYNIIEYLNNQLDNIEIYQKNFDKEKLSIKEQKRETIKEFIHYILTKAFNTKVKGNTLELQKFNFNKETLIKGYKILNELLVIINEKDDLYKEKNTLKIGEKDVNSPSSRFNQIDSRLKEIYNLTLKLSNNYFELIPFTENNNRLIVINDINKVKVELEKLQKLTYVENTIKLILGSLCFVKEINPIDYIYNSLNIKLYPLSLSDSPKKSIESDEIKLILDYIRGGKKTIDMNIINKQFGNNNIFGGFNFNNNFNIRYNNNYTGETITNIFKIEYNEKDDIEFSKNKNNSSNRVLLFHGTKPENLLGIFVRGLAIAPVESARCGSRFGNGIYLTDSFSKAKGYSYSDKRKYILIVDSILNNAYKIKKGNEYKEDIIKKGYECLINDAITHMSFDNRIYMKDGSSIFTTKIIEKQENNYNNNYYKDQDTEYVLYNEKLARVKYIVEMI